MDAIKFKIIWCHFIELLYYATANKECDLKLELTNRKSRIFKLIPYYLSEQLFLQRETSSGPRTEPWILRRLTSQTSDGTSGCQLRRGSWQEEEGCPLNPFQNYHPNLKRSNMLRPLFKQDILIVKSSFSQNTLNCIRLQELVVTWSNMLKANENSLHATASSADNFLWSTKSIRRV